MEILVSVSVGTLKLVYPLLLYKNTVLCWSEGRNATLRSKSPLLSRCTDKDKAGMDTLRLIGTRRRPATKAFHSAASSSSEAHVRSGPL
jgi:hypothetical protein